MSHLLNKCPICCGAKIHCNSLYQYGISRQLKRNGELSKASKKWIMDLLRYHCFIAINKECEFVTNADWEGGSPYNYIRIYLEDRKYYCEGSYVEL